MNSFEYFEHGLLNYLISNAKIFFKDNSSKTKIKNKNYEIEIISSAFATLSA